MLPTAQDLQELIDKVTYSVDAPVRVELTVTSDMRVKVELCGQGDCERVSYFSFDLLSLMVHREWPSIFLYQTTRQVERILSQWLQDCLRVNGKVI